jgi:hypothetical protein
MDKNHYKLYVPRDTWDAIVEKSEEYLGMKATDLAKMYLLKGLEHEGSLFATSAPPTPKSDRVSARKKITKNNSKENIELVSKLKMRVYNGEEWNWIGESDPDVFSKKVERFRLAAMRTGQSEVMEHEWLPVVVRDTSETQTAQQLEVIECVAEDMYRLLKDYEEREKDPREKFNMDAPITGEVTPYHENITSQ